MPNFLFIQSSPYDRAIGAEALPLPQQVTVINRAPSLATSEAQGLSIINNESHIHVTAGGVFTVSDGDRLAIDTTIVGPLGVVETTVPAVVVDSQVLPVVPDDPNRALAEALIAAGLATLDENGNLIAVQDAATQQIPPSDAPPPATNSDDAGIPITDNPVGNEQPDQQNLPPTGCETWQDVYYDPISDQIVTALYHSTGDGYEVFI